MHTSQLQPQQAQEKEEEAMLLQACKAKQLVGEEGAPVCSANRIESLARPFLLSRLSL
jgi:hypothetical protein